MATQVRVGGAWQTLTACKIYASAAWRTIVQIQVYSGGAWRVVGNYAPPPPNTPPPPSMSLTVSPTSQFVSGRLASLTSGTVSATPAGGVAPYTYSCTVSSADGTSRINSPTLASTTVTQLNVPIGQPETPEFTYTATDSLGQRASASFTITFDREIS